MNTKKKTPTKTDLAQIKGEYARHSTIHGIGYIFDSYLSVVDRALSLLAVLVLSWAGILVVCEFALVFALAPISPLFCHFFALALALYFTLS